MNDKRRDFCARYDGYGDFCVNDNLDKPLRPAPIINKTLEDHPVFLTPILVVGAMSHNSLRMTLETIVMQPGIHTDRVFVAIDEKLDELASLVELFQFHCFKVDSSYNYTEIFHKALRKMWETDLIEKERQTVIVIEEELILAPDFLYYFTQVYEIFMKAQDLAAVSMWNPNGFLHLNGDPSIVYRSNEFPGFGFMLKRAVYERFMKAELTSCCNKRAWYNWDLIDPATKKPLKVDVLMPDVSRVFRRPYDVSSHDFIYLSNLFNRRRKTNLVPFPKLELTGLETKASYENYLIKLINRASDFPNIDSCYKSGNISLSAGTKNVNYKIVYEQTDVNDLSNLYRLCECFNLFHSPSHRPRGLYMDNILRFNSHLNNFILVGNKNALLK